MKKHDAELKSLLPARVDGATDRALLATYSVDGSMYRIQPAGVAWPRGRSDTRAVIEWALEHGIPVHARGAGSNLTGACLGPGLVVDFRRYMTGIVSVDREKRLVRVQPGVVHGDLNRFLAPMGLFFPPDPASGDYCTIGGMIANNSSGARSVKYGAVIDWVESLQVVTARAASVTVTSADDQGHDMARILAPLLDRGLADYTASLPHAPKNCCGYRLERVRRDDGTFNLAALFTGSEGTLGLVTEATLKLAPLPSSRRLALANFASLKAMSEAVLAVSPLGPSACEVMDRTFLRIVGEHHPDLRRYIPDGTAAQLLIEIDGGDEETAHTMESLRRAVEPLALQFVTADEQEEQDELWAVRKAALPLLFTLPGPGRITAFIEDVSVEPRRLGEYLERLHGIFERMEVDSAVYGHAGDGNLHTRPILDLRNPQDLAKMKRIASEVFALVKELDGSISGEHGDGRVRSPFLPDFYGKGYRLLEEVKKALDPEGILNPGIVTGATPESFSANLRMGPDYRRRPLPPPLGGSAADLAERIEKCHGCAKCTTPSDTVSMCPVYKATGRPEAAPRAKMALAQDILSGALELNMENLEKASAVLAYCLGCGLCELDCPSRVSTPEVVRQLRAFIARRTGLPLRDRLLSFLSSPLPAPLRVLLRAGGLVDGIGPIRFVMEKVTGIDRSAPLFTFSTWTLPERRPPASADRVVYFPDTYAACCEPKLGMDCLRMLERAGFTPLTSPDLASCAPAFVSGDERLARLAVRRVMDLLGELGSPLAPLVFSEPTAMRVFTECHRPLAATEIGSGDSPPLRVESVDIMSLLLQRLCDGVLPVPEKKPPAEDGPILYHRACHVRGTRQEQGTLELLARLGVNVDVLPTGCCGQAGTFGLKAGEPGFETTRKIGAPVFEAIRRSGAAVVLSECSACRLNIGNSVPVKTIHPLTLVAAMYD